MRENRTYGSEDPAWINNPAFNIVKSYYLLYTRWLEDKIYDTPDLPEQTKRKAAFWVRCFLDAVSPSNNFRHSFDALRR